MVFVVAGGKLRVQSFSFTEFSFVPHMSSGTPCPRLSTGGGGRIPRLPAGDRRCVQSPAGPHRLHSYPITAYHHMHMVLCIVCFPRRLRSPVRTILVKNAL